MSFGSSFEEHFLSLDWLFTMRANAHIALGISAICRNSESHLFANTLFPLHSPNSLRTLFSTLSFSGS